MGKKVTYIDRDPRTGEVKSIKTYKTNSKTIISAEGRTKKSNRQALIEEKIRQRVKAKIARRENEGSPITATIEPKRVAEKTTTGTQQVRLEANFGAGSPRVTTRQEGKVIFATATNIETGETKPYTGGAGYAYVDAKGNRLGYDVPIQPNYDTRFLSREEGAFVSDQEIGKAKQARGRREGNQELVIEGIQQRARGQLGETSIKAGRFVSYGVETLFEGGKALLRGDTPTRDPVVRELIGKSSRAIVPTQEQFIRNPTTAIPLAAYVSFQVGLGGVLSKQLEAGRVSVSAQKTAGSISTKSTANQVTFVKKELGQGVIKYEQSPVGFRLPKSLGGLGNDPITQANFNYAITTRGAAIATSKNAARTTSESFISAYTQKGDPILTRALTQQTTGTSTDLAYSQTIKNFNPVTGQQINTLSGSGAKLSVKEAGLYNVKQIGFTSQPGINTGGFKEYLAQAGQQRVSFGTTGSEGINLKDAFSLNTKGNIALTKTTTTGTNTFLSPGTITTPPNPIQNLVSGLKPQVTSFSFPITSLLPKSTEQTTIGRLTTQESNIQQRGVIPRQDLQTKTLQPTIEKIGLEPQPIVITERITKQDTITRIITETTTIPGDTPPSPPVSTPNILPPGGFGIPGGLILPPFGFGGGPGGSRKRKKGVGKGKKRLKTPGTLLGITYNIGVKTRKGITYSGLGIRR